jgi:hypothetical protein
MREEKKKLHAIIFRWSVVCFRKVAQPRSLAAEQGRRRNRGSRNMVLAFLREQGPHGRNSLADDVANAEETGSRGWQSR